MEILTRMAAAAKAAGRATDAAQLVAVCKRQPDARVIAAFEAGQRVFGENRVEEAAERWAQLSELREQAELRFIGALQSRKVREAVRLFDVIETLDRDKLARKLADAIKAEGRAPKLYVQINTGEEAQKAGVSPQGADAFIARVRSEHGLAPVGLMAIPPAGEEPAMHFALLAKIAARNGLSELSMGMSADFETAIRFGATSVRIGTALFGERGANRDA